jgi:hypothetical protein
MNKVCAFEACTKRVYSNGSFCCEHSCWKCGGKHLYSRKNSFCQTCQNVYPSDLVTKVLECHGLQDKQSLNVRHDWYDRNLFTTLLTLYNDKKSISDEWDKISYLQNESTQRRKALENVQAFFKTHDQSSDSEENDRNQIMVTCPTCYDEFLVNDAIWS